MPRTLRRLIIAGSSIACAAFCLLWARSYWIADSLSFSDRGPMKDPRSAWRFYVWSESAGGRITLHYCRYTVISDGGRPYLPSDPCAEPTREWHAERITPQIFQSRTPAWAGFSAGMSGGITIVSSPHWAIVGMAGMPMLVLQGATLKKRRAAADECLVCGYDLRASPERCPECGTTKRNRL